MKPNRILISVINPSFNLMNRYSAVASVIYSFADLLRKEGSEIYVNDLELGEWEKRASSGASTASPAPSKLFKIFPTRIRELVKDLLLFRNNKKTKERILSIRKPDLVISWISYGNNYSVEFAKKWNVPLISIFDNPISEEYTYLKGFPPFFKRYIDKQEKRSILNSNALIVYSHAVKEHLIKKYKVNTKFYFKPFTDFKRMTYLEPGLKKKETINFAYIGSFFNWHKIEDLIFAFNDLNKEFQNCRLYLIGDGPEYAKIKAYSDQNPNITLTGKMDGEALNSLLTTIDVGVISNALWFHAPVKLFQYSSAGLAVISKRTPTVTELTEGKACYSFFDNVKELEESMKELLKHPETISKMGLAGQEHIKTNFSEKNYRDFFEAIFNDLN